MAYYNELYHYGVLGMKWGVRRNRKQLSKSLGNNRKRNMSDDAREVSKIKKKSVSEMSNAELRKYNDRIRLEQEYSRLNPSKIKKGLAFVTTAASVMGTAANIYTNGDRFVKIGKRIIEKAAKNKGAE